MLTILFSASYLLLLITEKTSTPVTSNLNLQVRKLDQLYDWDDRVSLSTSGQASEVTNIYIRLYTK